MASQWLLRLVVLLVLCCSKCLSLYGSICHGAHKLDPIYIDCNICLWTSRRFIVTLAQGMRVASAFSDLSFCSLTTKISSKAPVTPNGDATAFVQRSKTMSARCGIAAEYT